eukprot:GHVH01013705.1.p1 GENE.GHVH01013705.1~~GHVH01013705.1.p1  ORF type:complete len:270 (-),score=14.25 GHVH01013705.1:440-1249(-)
MDVSSPSNRNACTFRSRCASLFCTGSMLVPRAATVASTPPLAGSRSIYRALHVLQPQRRSRRQQPALDLVAPLPLRADQRRLRRPVILQRREPPLSQSTAHVISVLRDFWLPYFGAPHCVLSDRGAVFVSGEYTSFITKALGAYALHTSPYYPQGNAINEASHQSISKTLRSRIQAASSVKTTFARILADATIVHNASFQSAIRDSPFARLYGKDPCLPGLQQYSKADAEPDRLSTLQTRLLDTLHRPSACLPSRRHRCVPPVSSRAFT